jgi:hypothetical protein
MPVQDLRFSAKNLFADANVTVARAKKAPPKRAGLVVIMLRGCWARNAQAARQTH